MSVFTEAALFRFAILLFLLAFAAFIIGSILENEPIRTHFDTAAIVLLAAGCVAGTLLWFVLLRPAYQALYRKVVLGESLWRWLWRLLAGIYTLVLVALANVFADHHIAAVTWLPSSWFPRSQEILTGAYFISLFLLSLLVLPLVLMMLTSFILFACLVLVTALLYIMTHVFIISIYLAPFLVTLIFMAAISIALLAQRSSIERFINRVESADPNPLLDKVPRPITSGVRSIYRTYRKCHDWFSSMSFSHKIERFLCSFLSIVFLIVGVGFSYHYLLELSYEYVVLLPSFIPNDEAALNPGWGRDSAAICRDYPKDAWIRFIDDERIIVAAPSGKQEEDRNFSFIIGTCKRDRG